MTTTSFSKKVTSVLLFLSLIMSLTVINLTVVNAQDSFTYTTSYLGNSFGGKGQNVRQGGKWVQNWVRNTAFAAGAVFTAAEWDEAGRCTGIYKDGDVNSYLIWGLKDGSRGGELDGWGWGTGGYAVTANAEYFWIFTAANNLIRYSWDPNNIHTHTQQAYTNQGGETVIDLVEKNGTLYALRREGNNNVEIWNGGTGTTAPSRTNRFTIVGATALTVNPKSDLLWVIVGTEIREYTLTGVATGRVITDAGKPTSVTFDVKDGYLMATDDGKRQQILFYDITGKQPVLHHTFGDEGGIGSGIPGEYLPMKFFALIGAGTDEEGNVYVVLSKGETVIRKLTPDGKLVWEQHCFHFTDCCGFLPGEDGLYVYGGEETYRMDYDKGFGGEATIIGINRDQVKYPDDPRLGKHRTNGHVWVRELEGRKVLYQNGMYCQCSSGVPREDAGFDMYVFEDKPSMIVRPAGLFFDDGWAWDVDLNGDIWCGASSNPPTKDKIVKYAFLGFDGNNNPVYDKSSSLNVVYDRPTEFNKIERIVYDKENDILYIGGYTDKKPANDEWGLVGTVLARYDNWKQGNRIATYELDMPIENKLSPQAFEITGDYIFVCTMYGGIIHVYNRHTAKYIGQFEPTRTFENTGWVDTPHGVRATKRSNGEYIVLVEEDWRGKNVIYRWTPHEEK